MGYHRPGSLSVMWPLYCSIFFEKFGVLLPLFALLLKILASPNRARMISIFCYVLRQSLAVLQSLSLDDFSCHMLGCKCITIIYFKCATLAQCTTDDPWMEGKKWRLFPCIALLAAWPITRKAVYAQDALRLCQYFLLIFLSMCPSDKCVLVRAQLAQMFCSNNAT